MMTAAAFACVPGSDAETVAEGSELWSGCFGEPRSTVVTSSPMFRERIVTPAPQAGHEMLACLVADCTSCRVDNDCHLPCAPSKAWQ